ncbi:MAG: branched-chain amino acid aminotransferase [Solirubrobacteraceae bacterium]|jgi:branched-subunit amino acid aminotransferase/4-amino-4-deoxychorismate lyase|nr:branched-chain amino acid aminotransferase [Solirubrobacteraceae bacterium]
MLAILDGTVGPAAEARIPVTDEGLLRGDGVFEVIRLYGGRPFALEDHLRRLEGSASNLRLPIDVAALRADVESLLERNEMGDAALRLVVTRGGRRLGIVEPLRELPPTLALATVTYAPTRLLDAIKSLSYAANMLAGRLAREQGGDEALLVTPHGRVLEGPTCSFVCSLDGETLVTPPLSEHILDSITRRRLVALCDVRDRVLTREDLAGVREAFMASTLREVHPVRSIDGADLPAVPGPLTERAAARVRQHIQDELGVATG